MGAEEINYKRVLADLEAKRAVLDNAIAGIKQIMGQGSAVVLSATTPAPSGANSVPQDVRPDSFLGLTMTEAIKKYLRMARSKQATSQVADALQRGGVESTSRDFGAMVQTILRRMHLLQDEVVKVKGGWGLAEWYGPHIRRPSNPAGAKKSRQRRKRKPLTSKTISPKSAGGPPEKAASTKSPN